MDFKEPRKNKLKITGYVIQLFFTYFKWSLGGESRDLDKYRLRERLSLKDKWACFPMGSDWKPNNIDFTLIEKLKMKYNDGLMLLPIRKSNIIFRLLKQNSSVWDINCQSGMRCNIY